MPILDCTVTTCHHNVDQRCSLDKIKVEGGRTNTTEGTCCGSFKPRKEDRFMNVTGMPDAESQVECEACNCKYNDDCKCYASNIGIKGSHACACRETECATFTCSLLS